jgi:hypothetical protein
MRLVAWLLSFSEMRPLVSNVLCFSTPYSCSGFLECVNDNFHSVGALLWRQFGDSRVSMDHSFDRLHVSFTFIHTTLVTQSLLGIHPKVPSHYHVARDIKYIQIDTLDIEG